MAGVTRIFDVVLCVLGGNKAGESDIEPGGLSGRAKPFFGDVDLHDEAGEITTNRVSIDRHAGGLRGERPAPDDPQLGATAGDGDRESVSGGSAAGPGYPEAASGPTSGCIPVLLFELRVPGWV